MTNAVTAGIMRGDEMAKIECIVFSGNRNVDCAVLDGHKFEPGSNDVKEIVYHTPMGEGDAHFVDIFYENGEVHRYFNPNHVSWKD